MNNVITLTVNAINHIKKNMAGAKTQGFRLAVKKTGCSGFAYVPDIVDEGKPGDIHFQCESINIYVDQDSAKYLQGTVVDFTDNGLGQTKLVFHNPNAANLCGCGESFNLQEDS